MSNVEAAEARAARADAASAMSRVRALPNAIAVRSVEVVGG